MPRKIAGPCPSPGCPNRAGQCPTHKPAARNARGYDAQHDKLRQDYQRRMDEGETFTCWRCDTPINPKRWDLGHRTHNVYAGPECVPCNRATSGRR